MTTLEPVTDTVTNTEYINQRRVTQFNVYQEKKYGSYLDVLQYFTIYCVILLILAILRKRMILSYFFGIIYLNIMRIKEQRVKYIMKVV